MLRQISRVLRACLALAILGAGLIVGTAGTAAAEEPAASWTQTSTIQFGDKGEEIGTATVSRYDGTVDTIVVEYTIPGGYTESQLCVSSTAFTEKVEPGSCEHKNLDPQGDTGSYTLTVGAGEAVYLQLHIATQGETAYMGWVHGSPAFGNVEVPGTIYCVDDPTVVDDGVDADEDGTSDVCEDEVTYCVDDPTVVDDGVDADGDGTSDVCEDEVTYCVDDPTVVDDGVDADGDGTSDVCEDEVTYCVDDPTVVDDGVDADEDGTSDVCETRIIPVVDIPVVLPDTCPDGSLMTDVDEDGELTAADCTKVLPDTATPAEPATPEVPAAPAEPVPSVLPDAVTPTVVPVAAPAPAVAETAVLGAQVQRAPLARTGSSSTGLAAFGALLVLLGASASVAGRRTAARS